MTKPPRLEQFSASYDSGQDRMLLRIRSNDDAEYRFWLTRRYLALLWPILMKMADDFSALKTSDPLMQWKSVFVTGTVLYPIVVEPQHALLGEFAPGEKKSVSVRVYSPYNLPLSIDKTEVTEGMAVNWSYTKTDEAEQRLDLVVDESQYPGERIMKSVIRISARVDGKPRQIAVDVYGLRNEEESGAPA